MSTGTVNITGPMTKEKVAELERIETIRNHHLAERKWLSVEIARIEALGEPYKERMLEVVRSGLKQTERILDVTKQLLD